LNGVMPSTRIITYNIPKYPYENVLPQFLARYGYRTAAFHGNTGNFYNRRNAFEKMDFSDIYFSEELVSSNALKSRSWGIDDRDLLEFSARRLQEMPEPVCHFIITLTTHTPYTHIPTTEREVFAKPQSMAQDYLNNMRYLDNLLRDYVGSLKSATVVIYSDHSADPALAPEFKPHWDGLQEFVPCFIFNTDEDLGAQQRTRGRSIATDGTLTLLDIATFLRGQVAAANGVALATSTSELNPISSPSVAPPEVGKS
ncbi:MAG TPA: sulfatase-like hydrolase/transferase, partial [Pirellulales bacterium]